MQFPTNEDDFGWIDVEGAYVGDVDTQGGNFIGRDQTIYNYTTSSAAKAIPVSPKLLEKIRFVFEKNYLYAQALQKLYMDRLLLIYGDRHSGKYAAALSLTLDVCAKRNSDLRIIKFSDITLLSDFLESEMCVPSTVYIIQYAFRSPGLDPIDLSRHGAEICASLNNSTRVLSRLCPFDRQKEKGRLS